MRISALFSIGLLLMSVRVAADPCDGIDRSLTAEQKLVLAPSVATRLNVSSVEILQAFRSGSWTILYVDTHRSDEVFLFFAADPQLTMPLTSWSGAAARDEQESIRDWIIKNAPNIPAKLAVCFAWHVTSDRDM